MKTMSPLTIAVVVSPILFLTFAAVSSKSISGDNEIPGTLGDHANFPMTLQYVGQADRKDHVALRMSRTAAATYCKAANLQQATIDSRNQTAFLRHNLPRFQSTLKNYWTAARESRTDTMFIWNDGTPLDSSTVDAWGMTAGETYCVIFIAYDSPNSQFYGTTCDYEAHPLCMLIP